MPPAGKPGRRHKSGPRKPLLPPELPLPSDVQQILTWLNSDGFQAYVTGGAVRDLLLSRAPHDWDVATDALPQQVKALFPDHIPTGEKYGTITVRTPARGVEVTTFRADGRYLDGRRPESVNFSRDLKADLARRDFTINAMALGPDGRLLDPFGGRADLAQGRIATVGNPKERFREDALRMLRAIRFAAELGFTPETSVKRAILEEGRLIANVSAERIRDELSRILLAPHLLYGLRLLRVTGLLARIIPELDAGFGVTQNKYHAYSVYTHSLLTAAAVPPVLALRLAALFHDIGKIPVKSKDPDGAVRFHGHEEASVELAKRLLIRLRYPSGLIDRVCLLIRHHMFSASPEIKDSTIRKLIARVGATNIHDLIRLRAADALASGKKQGAGGRRMEDIDNFAERVEEILAGSAAFSLKDLAVNGRDLMHALGLPPGPKVGRLLEYLMGQVLDHPEKNTRETLLALARDRLSST
ncbi:MAG: CCA tRNA nucleotidyltransferase [Syntrophothermus sp.]